MTEGKGEETPLHVGTINIFLLEQSTRLIGLYSIRCDIFWERKSLFRQKS